MAESEDQATLSESILHGLAEVVDHPCSICQVRDKKEVESSHYCVDCDASMCAACTQSHASFPLMASHQVDDISKAPDTTSQKLQLPTQRCKEHHGKLVDRYCQDHNQLACCECVVIYHGRCAHMKYIPQFAKAVGNSQHFQAIKQTTEKLLKELKKKKASHKYAVYEMDKAEAESLQEVQDMGARLYTYVDNLVESESAKITSKYQQKKEKLKKSMAPLDEQIDATGSINQKLIDFQGDNESELFVDIKLGEKHVKEANKTLLSLNQSNMTVPKYNIGSALEMPLKNSTSLGWFEMEVPVTVTATVGNEINVRISKDTSDCNITGICFLPDASLIIADRNNKSLKRLNQYDQISSHLDMSVNLWDACYVDSTNELAVTLPTMKNVQYVSVGDRLKTTGSFSVNEECRGIAHSHDELFICCGDPLMSVCRRVKVYSLSGSIIRTISHGPDGNPLFTTMDYIAMGSCGSKLHVADADKGIITLDKVGDNQASFTDPELRGPAGIFTLDNNDLLVAGFLSNNVLHVSKDGKKVGVVLTEKGGIINPRAVCYDWLHSRLIVSTKWSNTLKVYATHIE